MRLVVYGECWTVCGDVACAASSKLKGNAAVEGRCEGEDVEMRKWKGECQKGDDVNIKMQHSATNI